MAIFVTGDLHGNSTLIQKTVTAIENMAENDTLIINGDGAGARGDRMNAVVKVFYEVRRGETAYEELLQMLRDIIGKPIEIPKDWVFGSVHAGIFRKLVADRYTAFRIVMEQEILSVLQETLQPIATAAKKSRVRIVYLPGNGELVPSDFSTKNISVEESLPPEERFYQKIAKNGYFEQYGIEYIPYACRLGNSIALIGTNLLDIDEAAATSILASSGLLNTPIKTVVVHYPPTVSPLGTTFGFWTPNKVDIKRTDALSKILSLLKLQDTTVIFGHIHLGANDARMAVYPPTMGFIGHDYVYTWIKPGAVVRI